MMTVQEASMSAGYTWDDIAEKYATHIRAYVHKFTRLGAYKDDVVQDTLIRLKVLLDQGRLPGNIDELSGLCIDIARTYSLNQIRKMERLNRVGSTTDDGVVPDQLVEDQERNLDHNKTDAQILDDLIGNLPTNIGQVLQLRRDGLTMTAIASRLGCTKNAVAKRERKGIQLMRRLAYTAYC
ncbi:MAG: sigma-70 family RNA polymerase sigma factor [Aureliella sp.]